MRRRSLRFALEVASTGLVLASAGLFMAGCKLGQLAETISRRRP